MFAYSVIAWASTLVCAYLMGSFSTSITVAKLFYHQDIRKMGSGNAGATNTLRNYGVKKALLVMLGDSLKAILAMVLAKLLVGRTGSCMPVPWRWWAISFPPIMGCGAAKA